MPEKRVLVIVLSFKFELSFFLLDLMKTITCLELMTATVTKEQPVCKHEAWVIINHTSVFSIYYKKLFTEKNETLHKLILDIYIINKSHRNTHNVDLLYISSKSEKEYFHSKTMTRLDVQRNKPNCLETDLRGGIYQS